MQQPPNYYPYPPQPVYPAPTPQRQPPSWGTVIAVIAMLLFIAGASWFVLIPAAGDIVSPSSWVYGDNNITMFMTWTSNGNNLLGTFDMSYISGTSVKSINSSFTGVRNGGSVSLTNANSGETLSGTLGFRTLTLDFPSPITGEVITVTLHPGNVSEYNSDIINIQAHHPAQTSLLVYARQAGGNSRV